MSIISQAVKHMLAAGMDHDQIVQAVADMEQAQQPKLTARQARNKRYYEKNKASEKRLNPSYSDVSDATKIKKEKSPPTPPSKEKNKNLEPNGSLSVSEEPTSKRNSYPDDFEKFWKAYPTDPNMSKAEAHKAWKKLDIEDRGAAAKAVGPYRLWASNQTNYRILHAVRFLSQRRFDGFAAEAGTVQRQEPIQTEIVYQDDEPEYFDFCIQFRKQRDPNFDYFGKTKVSVPVRLRQTFLSLKKDQRNGFATRNLEG